MLADVLVWNGSAGQGSSEAQEQLCWLMRMGAALLADSAEGETPLVPDVVADCCEDSDAAGQPDPVLILCQQLLQVFRLPLDQSISALASPR